MPAPSEGAMLRFEYSHWSQTRTGYQRHHLIPLEVVRHPAFADIFSAVGRVGFNPHDFASNGVCLPGCEALAIRTGLPLHRGPHPHYTQFVSEQVAFLCRDVSLKAPSAPMALMVKLSHLQGSLRRSLDRSNTSLWLNRRDPRHCSGRMVAFDDDLRQLSMTDLLV